MLEGSDANSPIDIFGGLVSFQNRSDLQNGQASEATNVSFVPGAVATRVGYEPQSTVPYDGTNATNYVNSLFGFPRQDGTVRERIALSDVGTVYSENPEGTLTAVQTGMGRNMLMKGATIFNKAWLAFSNGRYGVSRIRKMNWNYLWPHSGSAQYDFYPLAQGGVGQNATYDNTKAGSLSTQGNHQAVLLFETTDGFLTAPNVMQSANIGSATEYGWKDVPIGPINTLRRRFYITPVDGTVGQLYTHPKLWINDNVSDQLYADIDDTSLQAEGELLTLEQRLRYSPPPALGVVAYSGRVIVFGANTQLPTYIDGTGLIEYGFPNLEFHGGSVGGVPTGWTVDSATGALVTQVTDPGVTLAAWKITCDGSSAQQGKIISNYSNRQTLDYPLAKRIYVAVRVRKSADFTAGKLVVGLRQNGATDLPLFSLDHNQLTTDLNNFAGVLFDGIAASSAGNLEAWVEGSDGNPPAGSTVTIDGFALYDFTDPIGGSVVWGSDVNDPDGFSLLTGFQNVSLGDGQLTMNAFELNGSLYYCKERSIWVTNDDGSDFVNWPMQNVSYKVGCVSSHGVGYGDRWVVIASSSGLYYFSGGQPTKISQEIQPTWDRINKLYNHLIWVAVDATNQEILVGVPLDGASQCNYILACDYVEGILTDPMLSIGRGRKWSLRPVAFRDGVYAERDSGSRVMMYGGGDTGGIASIVRASTAVSYSDNFGAGAQAYTSRYTTAPTGAPLGRSLFTYLAMKIRGSGTLLTSLLRPGGTSVALESLTLSDTSNYDLELKPGLADTQTSVTIETSGLGDWFSISRLGLWSKKALAQTRGHNL